MASSTFNIVYALVTGESPMAPLASTRRPSEPNVDVHRVLNQSTAELIRNSPASSPRSADATLTSLSHEVATTKHPAVATNGTPSAALSDPRSRTAVSNMTHTAAINTQAPCPAACTCGT